MAWCTKKIRFQRIQKTKTKVNQYPPIPCHSYGKMTNNFDELFVHDVVKKKRDKEKTSEYLQNILNC